MTVPSLIEQIGGDGKRTQVIEDAVRVLDAEVAGKSGLGGMAVQGAYRVVKGVSPGFVTQVVDHLLDDFLRAVDPVYQEAVEKGGPHGPYDTWGYDSDVQFLASRGYAVLQVNYRGSGGRGRAFMERGYGEWGGKMQDDIADGVRWAIDEGLVDADRICTYGASYGGYAAMMQPIRYPALYKCAIGYVGVYDLEVMKQEGDITDRASGRRYLDRVLGTDTARLKAWSPAQNVDSITIPVLLVQGNIDKRVPMEQFDALRKAFEARGVPVETLVARGEGHGFYKPENRAELYRRMEAFLDKYIGD